MDAKFIHAGNEANVLSSLVDSDNSALPRFLDFLLVPEPVVEKLPTLFLPPDSHVDESKISSISVGGKLLYAQIRWLDDIADSDEPAGSPTDVHKLADVVYRGALASFLSGLVGTRHEASFLAVLARLNNSYATSLALDGAFQRGAAIHMDLAGYIAHAEARAAPLRTSLEALLLLAGINAEQAQRARECFNACAAAMQFADDVLDVEEDYRDRRLSWIVAETLSYMNESQELPDADKFYEAALLGGHIESALNESERLYVRAKHFAEGHFPGCLDFLKSEEQRVCALRNDLAELTASYGRGENL